MTPRNPIDWNVVPAYERTKLIEAKLQCKPMVFIRELLKALRFAKKREAQIESFIFKLGDIA